MGTGGQEHFSLSFHPCSAGKSVPGWFGAGLGAVAAPRSRAGILLGEEGALILRETSPAPPPAARTWKSRCLLAVEQNKQRFQAFSEPFSQGRARQSISSLKSMAKSRALNCSEHSRCCCSTETWGFCLDSNCFVFFSGKFNRVKSLWIPLERLFPRIWVPVLPSTVRVLVSVPSFSVCISQIPRGSWVSRMSFLTL